MSKPYFGTKAWFEAMDETVLSDSPEDVIAALRHAVAEALEHVIDHHDEATVEWLHAKAKEIRDD